MRRNGAKRIGEKKTTPRHAVELTKKGYYKEAYEIFSIDESFETKPVYMGCYALVVAVVKRDFRAAERYCMDALRLESKNPIIHLCLGRIYKLSRRYDLALITFKNGLRYAKDSKELHREIATYDMWRKPIIPFLERDNIINRGLNVIRKILKIDLYQSFQDS